MRLLVAGACGFAGSTLIRAWVEAGTHAVTGLDSFVRPGSETNRALLGRLGVAVHHADVRSASDVDALPACDAVIDAAANPSVLAGTPGYGASRQLVEHNLLGTVNLLEYCRRHTAALVVLSTSRVYSAHGLAALPLRTSDDAFALQADEALPDGASAVGINEHFSTDPPLSLYGATKRASEQLALEYGTAFDFPVWINRCGVLAGGGQFGRPDQGILAYWVNAWLRQRPLTYVGFGGSGRQVRDCLHPADLVPLIDRQLAAGGATRIPQVLNVGGGMASAWSLRQLSAWCRERLGDRPVAATSTTRPLDVPWLVLDASRAKDAWSWSPARTTEDVLTEILAHAREHPEWLELSGHP